MRLIYNFFKIFSSPASISFADQIIISLGNFTITIILVKYLGLEIFGQFSFLWLFLLLLNAIQISYIISPMFTNAPKQSISNINLFYGGIFCQQLILATIIFLIAHYVLKFFGDHISSYPISKYFISFPFAIVAIQLQQFLRRLLFSKKLYFKAVLSDFITYLSIVLLIIYLNHYNKLNIESIFWSFFLAFSVGTIINSPVLLSLKYRLNNIYLSIKENWIIAKWMLASTLLQWVSGNLWIINAGLILGPVILGIVRACFSIINIANLIFQSLENVFPGEISKKFKSGSINKMQIYLKRFALRGLILILFITILIIIFSKFLLTFIYGLETAKYYYFLIFLSLTLPLTFLKFPLDYGLRTLGKTKPMFVSYLFSSFIAVIGSRLIISQFQLNGLIFGLFIHQITITGISYMAYVYYLKKMKNKEVKI